MGRGMMRCAMGFAVLVLGCGGSEFTAQVGDAGGGGPLDGSPMDAAVLGWCASRPTPPTFCADFDETNDVATTVSAWSDGRLGDGNLTVQADPSAPSQPNVLSGSADGTAPGAKSSFVTLGDTYSREQALQSVHAETALRLDQGKITGLLDSVTFLGVYIGGDTLFLALTKAGLVLGIQGPVDGGAIPFTQVNAPLTAGNWAGSFAIDVDLRTGKVRVSHDADDVADTTFTPSGAPQSATMAIGVVPFGATGPLGLSFDDVRMDLN